MEVLRVAILDFCRRQKGRPFCPTAVIRQMFPEDWELFREEVIEETMQLCREDLIEVSLEEEWPSQRENAGAKILILGLRKPK